VDSFLPNVEPGPFFSNTTRGSLYPPNHKPANAPRARSSGLGEGVPELRDDHVRVWSSTVMTLLLAPLPLLMSTPKTYRVFWFGRPSISGTQNRQGLRPPCLIERRARASFGG
jgi:hypothetical protein